MVLAGTELIRARDDGRSILYQVFGVRTACTGQGSATTSVPYELGTRVDASIRINRPRQEVYWFWRDFSNLPQFMKHLKSVEITGPGRSQWVAQGPGGSTVDWTAETISEVDGERIGWRSVEGSQVDNAGSCNSKMRSMAAPKLWCGCSTIRPRARWVRWWRNSSARTRRTRSMPT